MTTLGDRTWSEIIRCFRGSHPALARPWLNSLEPVEIRHGVIRVRADTPERYNFLTKDCQAGLNQAAQVVTGRLVTVQLLPPDGPRQQEQPLSFETETDNIVLNKDYTFDQFVTGLSNQFAHAACVAAATNPGQAYNPLYIHGPVGLGKTHLLQAACHEMLSAHPGMRVLYISCETFMNHFVEAVERGALHQFRYRYRHVDALVIDDIHFLARWERSREEFFHTFNTLYQSQKQIILSADESPSDIPSLEDRLISRFNWGLVARIDPPDLETRMAIVRKKARLRCADLPEEVVHYIASAVDSNTRELEGALTRVLALAQHYCCLPDMAIAREALGSGDVPPPPEPSIADILAVVAERYQVRLSDLRGKRRNRSIALPRQIGMYLARELTSLSLEEIGGLFGGRDHTTVLHAVRSIHDQQEQDPTLAAALREMASGLRRRQQNRPASTGKGVKSSG